jgi:hypothetical protein
MEYSDNQAPMNEDANYIFLIRQTSTGGNLEELLKINPQAFPILRGEEAVSREVVMQGLSICKL